MKFGIIAAALFVASIGAASAQNGAGVAGRWLTEDGKGVIAIAPCGNSICGKIDWMNTPPEVKPGTIIRDQHNHDPSLREHPVCGLQILYGFRRENNDPGKWVEGAIYDPESGDTYHANITLVDANHLKLRGYIGIPLLGESQTWTRDGNKHPPCRAG